MKQIKIFHSSNVETANKQANNFLLTLNENQIFEIKVWSDYWEVYVSIVYELGETE